MIDFNKPVRTKSGEPVEIISTEGRGHFPVLGYIGGSSCVSSWTINGRYGMGVSSWEDLENIPQKRSGWVVIDPELGEMLTTIIFGTQSEAIAFATVKSGREGAERVVAPIKWEE